GTSALPTVPSGSNSTVTPVPRPVQWPARTPATGSSLTDCSRQRADLAREVDEQLVKLFGPLEHEHVSAPGDEHEARVRDQARHLLRVARRREEIGGDAGHPRRVLAVRPEGGRCPARRDALSRPLAV